MTGAPVFTVFTPTFNRAHTLAMVHESLRQQTFRDFEWLIVDDGSTDGTTALIQGLLDEAAIPIRYIRQENRGKHFAYNRGVREARGDFFLCLDSDDRCPPDALSRFHSAWTTIPPEARSDFSGVTGLCADDDGAIVDGPLPVPVIDGHPHEVMARLGRRGEMWGFHRTDVLRAYPFPEFEGEKFCPEGLVWNRISRRYQIRFINEIVRHYTTSGDSLSSRMVDIRRRSPRATALYYAELLQTCTTPGVLARCVANLVRYSPGDRATLNLVAASTRAVPPGQWPALGAGAIVGFAVRLKDRFVRS